MAKILNTVFGIGIAVVVFIVALLGIQAFYPAPEYSTFCNDSFYLKPPIPTFSIYDCQKNISVLDCISIIETKNIDTTNEEDKTQDMIMMKCNDDYQAANKTYGKNFFIIASILGLLLIITAYLLINIINLSAGIAFSGIVLIVVAFVRGWMDTNDIMKFIFGLVIAAAIIYLTLKINSKFSEEKENNQFAKNTKK